eukprot:1958024-Rhodomonas_salina.3
MAHESAAQPAIRHAYDAMTGEWTQTRVRVIIEQNPFEQGASHSTATARISLSRTLGHAHCGKISQLQHVADPLIAAPAAFCLAPN